MDGVTEGRVVHYVVEDGTHRAAQIVRAGGDDRINVLVALDGQGDTYELTGLIPNGTHAHARDVPFDESASRAHTWHWIEKA